MENSMVMKNKSGARNWLRRDGEGELNKRLTEHITYRC